MIDGRRNTIPAGHTRSAWDPKSSKTEGPVPMKVICNRGALLEAISVAGNAVAARTPKPVLLCVKLTAADDKLTIAATDLEVAIRYSDAQVQIEQAGEALLPADKLRDIVRESVDDTLSIEVSGDSANIKGND